MGSFFGTPDWSKLTDIIIRVVPAIICITLHEIAHGYVAYRLGDNTAKDAGRLTLNPIRHIDPFGLLMMLVAGFGWAKPVPVDMDNFKNPKRGMAVTALAGPVTNVLIALVTLFFYGLLYIPLSNSSAGQLILRLLVTTAYLSCAFAVFNMLPIPPLDGAKIFFSVLPDKIYNTGLKYERFVMIALMILVFTGVLSRPLSFLADGLYNVIFPVAEFGFDLMRKIKF